MPRRTDIKSILIVGAGPIIIGQGCEFDYSGAQACKAIKEEGYRVILVNSNPATIMTDPEMADATYIEPITWPTIAKIIEKERPDALLPTMGGQTALNTALDLAREGVLEKFGVQMIGATRAAIDKAEDRELFKKAMESIGLKCARGAVAHSMEEAMQVQAAIGFPVIIRPSFTLADARAVDRGIHHRLEGVRDGGGARPQGQLHHHLFDRKFRSHGRAHRRFDHGRAGTDADRQGIPAHARCLHRLPARDRRGYRWLERAVRHQPQGWKHGDRGDEPARQPLVGAGLQGHGFSDRESRGQARGRLHAG